MTDDFKVGIGQTDLPNSLLPFRDQSPENLNVVMDEIGLNDDFDGSEEEGEPVDEEVIRVFKEALNDGNLVERLDLSNRHLKFLPEPVGKIHGLIVLHLSHNHLQAIPDSVAGLQKLEELTVSSNLLETLPDSIGLLVNLKFLNVSGNKLKKLPESIAGCRSLIELDLSFNNLMFLPINIGYGLVNLEKLYIHLNKLMAFPNSICEMKSLRCLDAHINAIHGIPHGVGKLTNLEILNLSGNFNNLTEVPETIGDLVNLRDLDLSNNQIRALPESIYQLHNLVRLNVAQNPLIFPPLEVVEKGVVAIKEYMMKRRIDMLEAENQRSLVEEKGGEETGWYAWGASVVTSVYAGVSGYTGGNARKDSDLNQHL